MRLPRPLKLAAGSTAAILVAVALTACSGAGGSGGCTPIASGTASDAVSVTGRFGAKPTVSFPKPLHVSSTQVSAVSGGTGTPIEGGQQVVTDVTLLSATTGEVVTSTEYTGDGAAARFVVDTVAVRGLRQALTCARVGERVVAVIPPKDAIPAGSRPTTLSATDSVVAVIDVRHAYLARADGADQVMAGGLPAVVLGPDGRPGVTLPEGDPPTTLTIADLKKGSGALLEAGDNAVVQFTGIVWKPSDATSNGTVFQSTWQSDGQSVAGPTIVPLTKGQLIEGFRRALVGQRVGSQVIVVIPPKDGYGAKASGKIPASSTLVFVIDVLGKA